VIEEFIKQINPDKACFKSANMMSSCDKTSPTKYNTQRISLTSRLRIASKSADAKAERIWEDPSTRASCSRTLNPFSSPSLDPKAEIPVTLSAINPTFLEFVLTPERKSLESNNLGDEHRRWRHKEKETELANLKLLSLVGRPETGKWVKGFTADITLLGNVSTTKLKH